MNRHPQARIWRSIVAVVGHAPGLWLMFRETQPRALWPVNALAVALTLLAMAVAGWAVSSARGAAILAAWLVGHFAWGAYLAVRLRR